MRILRVLIATGLLLTVAAGHVPARADTWVTVGNDHFGPRLATTNHGTVNWGWGCRNSNQDCTRTHNVTAYKGATFASGDLSYPAWYTTTFDMSQLPIFYRCTIHSTIDAEGRCSGMCGRIYEHNTDPPIAAITTPRPGSFTTSLDTLKVPVRIGGIASDAIGILRVDLRLYDQRGIATDYSTTCDDCAHGVWDYNPDFTTNVEWHRDFELLPGSYVAEAKPYDVPGTYFSWSQRVQFWVL